MPRGLVVDLARARRHHSCHRSIPRLMALGYKARRRWSLVILLIGLPLYVVAAVNVIDLFDRPPFWVELAVYVILGFIWAMPFKFVFKGVGKEDPDQQNDQNQ